METERHPTGAAHANDYLPRATRAAKADAARAPNGWPGTCAAKGNA